jgi:hypothetical protein
MGALFSWKWIGAVGVAAFLAGAAGGWSVRDAFCDAAAARAEVERQKAIVAGYQDELKRIGGQLAEVEGIQRRDAARALELEQELRKNQEAVNDTPHNPNACLDRDASRRVRGIR